ncbi:hypothetical protein E2562_031114 [Oryza meyeriana var. granulata]|uniref:Uncharacterized protein n=1 Tax=Oryza meyeriana var. granulata TaxID=110450 RepID=A0A6G1DQB2_9ORYZ|nr:hypothetical protein E2562_031114 [Oryza meyeriana var. granulata]
MAVDCRAGATGEDGSREETFLYRKAAAAPASTSSSSPPSSSPFAAAVQGGLALRPVSPSCTPPACLAPGPSPSAAGLPAAPELRAQPSTAAAAESVRSRHPSPPRSLPRSRPIYIKPPLPLCALPPPLHSAASGSRRLADCLAPPCCSQRRRRASPAAPPRVGLAAQRCLVLRAAAAGQSPTPSSLRSPVSIPRRLTVFPLCLSSSPSFIPSAPTSTTRFGVRRRPAAALTLTATTPCRPGADACVAVAAQLPRPAPWQELGLFFL